MPASTEDETTEPTTRTAGGKTRRCLLISLSVALVIVMIIGIIFVAHAYYHSWGGQGFLRVRSWEIDEAPVKEECKTNSLRRALPLSSYFTDAFGAPMESGSTYASTSSGVLRFSVQGSHLESDNDVLQDNNSDPELKAKRKNVPFYICGDQSISCEAFNQPYICCATGFTCHTTPFTNSGIFCCNASSTCASTPDSPPLCPSGTISCSPETGGGCCPSLISCSPNGCIEFEGSGTPPPITSIYTTTRTTILETDVEVTPTLHGFTGGESYWVSTSTSTRILESEFSMVVGGMTRPKATVTKQGEVAQVGRAERRIERVAWRWLVSPVVLLAVVAGGMIML